MKKTIKIFFLIITITFSLMSLFMIGVCIWMQSQYLRTTMGNEASGFFSIAILITIIISIISIFLWLTLLDKLNRQKMNLK